MAISFGKQNSKYKQYGYPNLLLDFAKTKSLIESINKNNPITFTRASSVATYVGADGLIKRAATNLALYSEQFDNAGWSKTNTTVQANQVIAPDGKQTADKLVASATTSSHYLWRTVLSGIKNNTSYTISMYAKAGEYDKLIINTNNVYNAFVNGFTTFDLTNGTVSTSGGTSLVGKIESVGAGWYRCSATDVTTSSVVTESMRPYFYVNSSSSFTGDGTSGIYIWGAQFEEGTVATPYIKTTSTVSGAPRFDHNPLTGESLGLLVEEERTNLQVYSEQIDNPAYTKASITATANQIIAPDGTLSADLMTNLPGTPTSYHGVTDGYAAGTYTISAYVKAGNNSKIMLGDASSELFAWFDLSTATLQQQDAGVVGTISDAGNGWYRISAACPASGLTRNYGVFQYVSLGSGRYTGSGETFYLWGVQVESATFPTSYIPTEGSAVTRTPDIAAIQDADFSYTNLLSYSESFDVGWSLNGINAFGSGNIANAIVSPDGQTTADLITEDTSTGAHFTSSTTATTVSGATYTASVFVKPAGRTALRISRAGGAVGAGFDLSAMTTVNAAGASSTIKDVGSGWYLLTMTFSTVSTSTTVYIELQTSASSSSQSYAGNGTSGIYLWGAQLTQTEYPVDYVSTRNLLTDSQDFERSRWLKTRATIENDIVQAPDGTLTADKLKEDSSPSNTHRIDTPTDISTISGQSYVFTVYAKSAGRDWLAIQLQSSFGGNYAYFDLSNGTIGVNSTLSESITSVGNGWYRISITVNAASTGTGAASFILAAGNNVPSYSGDGTSGVYLWGAQLEPGSTATEYLRTTDVVGKKYPWYEYTEGTLFADYTILKDVQSPFNIRGAPGEPYNRIGLSTNSSTTQTRAVSAIDGILLYSDYKPVTLGDDFRLALSYSRNNYGLSFLGSNNPGTRDFTIPGYTRVDIGDYVGSGTANMTGHIKRIAYWNRRLADSTLQGLTSGSFE